MTGPDLLPTLAGGLAAALGFGYAARRIGLSPIVGYLVAGVVVGPHTPGFVADTKAAEQFADIGVVLLMFGVGLQFHLEELLAVRRTAVPGAVVQCLATAAIGFAVGQMAGWGGPAAVVFGLSVSVASTVVLTRVLGDNGDLHTPAGHVGVGWLVVQDLFAVLVLVALPAVYGPNAAAGPAALAGVLAIAVAKLFVLVAVVLVVGGRVIPWLLRKAGETGSRELFTLTVLVVALGIAVGAAAGFGVSIALGAFLAGMVVGRSDFSVRAATEALPFRDAFAVLFFVSVGMLFDPGFPLRSPGLVAAAAAVVLVGTPAVVFGVLLLLRQPARVAVPLALAFAQIGEFSFIVAGLGKTLGVMPDDATQAVVAVAMISISLNPIVYRLGKPLAAKLAGRTPAVLTPPAESDTNPEYRAVVVGFGPVGRTVCRLLRENGIQPTVIELNLETVDKLRAEGTAAVYGDATHRETLAAAGLATAGSLVLSSAGMTGSAEVIRTARALNPTVRVLARAAYSTDVPALRAAGAEGVISGETEVALAVAEDLLRRLGATAEQIDRERDRVRADLTAGG